MTNAWLHAYENTPEGKFALEEERRLAESGDYVSATLAQRASLHDEGETQREMLERILRRDDDRAPHSERDYYWEAGL